MRLSRPEAPPPAIASPLKIAGGVFITAIKTSHQSELLPEPSDF